MKREDWPERLAAFLEERRDRTFAFGEHDCALFAADWILEATGEDPLGELRGTWQDEISALRVLKDRGPLSTIADELLSARIAPAFAQRGDVVLSEITGREGLGVCVGERFAAPSDVGVEFVPMSFALMAWKV